MSKLARERILIIQSKVIKPVMRIKDENRKVVAGITTNGEGKDLFKSKRTHDENG